MLGDPRMVNKFKPETVDPTSRTRGQFKDSVPTLSAGCKGEEVSQSGEMVDEVQDQGLSLDLPLVPLVNPPVSTNLGMKFLELINNSSLKQISKLEEWIDNCFQENKGNWIMVKRKKN